MFIHQSSSILFVLNHAVNEYVPSSNIGYKMLLKLGWKGEASGLGKKEQGESHHAVLFQSSELFRLPALLKREDVPFNAACVFENRIDQCKLC